MVEQRRPTFALELGEVSLKAPETPLYLTLAVQVLDARRKELEDGGPAEPAPVAPTPPSPPAATAVETAPEETGSGPEVGSEPETPAMEPSVAVEAANEPEAAAVAEPEPQSVEAFAPAAVEEPQAAVTLLAPVADAPPSPPPAAPEAPARRARWFRGQLPVVTFEDGTSRVMESLDALKALLSSRGLRPHPRGDASMLLWQVRNRLGLAVGQVDA